MKTSLILLLTLLMASCATTEGPKVPALVESKNVVEIDKRLLEECPDMPKLEDSTDEKTLAAVKVWLGMYSACKTKKHELNALIKKAFNLKEKE